MSDQRWVAIDFETATREATSACALGVAVIEGLDVVDSTSWLIQPPFNEYEFWNTHIHGISAEDTRYAPEFDEVWPEVAAVLQGGRLLAHNASFDMRVLSALITSRELHGPGFEYACTLSVARKAWPHLANHRLDTVCDHCGIGLVHHDAASDALGCARVAIESAYAVGTASVGAVIETLGVKIRRLQE